MILETSNFQPLLVFSIALFKSLCIFSLFPRDSDTKDMTILVLILDLKKVF